MSDQYLTFVNSSVGKQLAKQLGLPSPSVLERYNEGQEFVTGSVMVGASNGGRLINKVAEILGNVSQPILVNQNDRNYAETSGALIKAGVNFYTWQKQPSYKLKALVFDATGIKNSEDLSELYHFFHPVIKKMLKSARIVILGSVPELCEDPKERTAQRALVGFTKAIGKEMIKGGAANLVYVADGAEDNIESSLQFFLSAKSAYVSGQVANVYKQQLVRRKLNGQNH